MATDPRPKSDFPTMLLHWGIVLALIASLVTGLRIAADMPQASWANVVAAILPQGNVILWHLWAAVTVIGLSVAYVIFLWRAGLLSRVALDAVWWRALKDEQDTRAQWHSINVAVYWLAFAAVLMAGLTGLLLDLVPGLAPYASVAMIHQWAAWSLPVYMLCHILALVAQSGWAYLLKILNPRPAYALAGSVALLAGAGASAALMGLENAAGDTLRVPQTKQLPELDGRADDAAWSSANTVIVPTARGANAPGGETDVTVKALHDGEHIYALFQWPDSTQSFKHLPLVKTAQGWKVTQTEFGIQDEDSYYEDKFGVMLSTGNGIAGDGSIHLGNKPLDGKPGPSGGRGLHYTTDGHIVDVWHWKSVRSGNPIMSQIDDNYFGPPLEPKAKGRYTGGYTKDPNSSGGFAMNWEAYSDDVVTPKRLPRDPSVIAAFQSVDLDPNQGDEGHIFMQMADTVPYDPALDTYPVGTLLPAVLVKGPFEGDRGDVSAVSQWQDGVWTMEVRRKLDTGSFYDVPFRKTAPTYLWVAAFDHAQTRHSQHLYPVTVELE